MSTVITANRLADGVVVFLGAAEWVTSIREAAVLDKSAEAEAVTRAKRDEDRQIVVEPYPIEVVDSGGGVMPKVLREIIRARGGPTVRPDLSIPGKR